MSLLTEHHFCNGCGKTTTWKKHASFDTCEGCRTRFPCVGCKHTDCREARGEIAACDECKTFEGHARSCSKRPTETSEEVAA